MNDATQIPASAVPTTATECVAEGDSAAGARPARRRRKPTAKLAALTPTTRLSSPIETAARPRRLVDPRWLGRRFAQYFREGWRWLQARRASQIAGRRMSLCESVSLGEKRFLALVQVDGQRFLIGGAAGSVALLAQLGATREFNGILRQARSQGISNV